MKITFFLIAVFATLALVAADRGFYSPRAFYTLDPHGRRGQVYYISPNIQRRLRRQVVSGSSSSSSSVSSSADGGPVYFSTSGSTYTSPGQGLSSRFGDDTPQGVYHTSSGYLGADGRIHYTNNQQGFLG